MSSDAVRIANFYMQLDELERQLIRDALERNGGSVAKAARELELPQHLMERKMERLGISPRERPLPGGHW